MSILAALRRAEAKLQKQADKVRQQLDNVFAAFRGVQINPLSAPACGIEKSESQRVPTPNCAG